MTAKNAPRKHPDRCKAYASATICLYRYCQEARTGSRKYRFVEDDHFDAEGMCKHRKEGKGDPDSG